MTSILLAALALAPSQTAAPTPAPPEPVRYTIELLEPVEPLVGIHLGFRGDEDGESVVSLAAGWAGLAETGGDLELVEIRVGDEQLDAERLAPHAWQVRHAPGAALELLFLLRPTRHRASSGPPEYYLPILEPRLLHAIGAQTLPAPDHLAGDEERPITLAWRGFAEEGWRAISSFGEGSQEVSVHLPLDAFRHALFLAGDLRLSERRIHGQALWIAMHGEWSFDDAAFVTLAERVVTLEREFFDDHALPFYLISLIPVGAGGRGSSWGGTGLTDSFALFVTRDNGIGASETGGGIAWLLAHELFHQWNGHVITLAQPEELGYWFSEGFTDFYTRRLLARAGFLTEAQVLASWNQKLAALAASPERRAPAERVREAFWRERAVGDLPYQRGDVIALFVDEAIRARSGGERSLDDLMRLLATRAHAGAGPLTNEELVAAIGELAGEDAAAAVRAWAVDGEEPALGEGLGGTDYRLVPCEVPTFDTGFDHESSVASGTVSGVRPGGPAERAGLRDGMRFASWSVHLGNTVQPIEVTVRENGESRKVSYLPHGTPVAGYRMERR